jgi:endoribonuclease Dicer
MLCPLGDGFLKYLSTVYVFVTCPSLGEGSMHTTRQQLISNKTLFQCATSVSLPAYIQSKPFAIRQWHPPNFESDQVNRESNNKPVDRPTPGQDVKDLQDIGSVKKPTTNAAQERSLSQAEAPTEATTARKPRRRKQRQSEDTQWLGDKVTHPTLSRTFQNFIIPCI